MFRNQLPVTGNPFPALFDEYRKFLELLDADSRPNFIQPVVVANLPDIVTEGVSFKTLIGGCRNTMRPQDPYPLQQLRVSTDSLSTDDVAIFTG